MAFLILGTFWFWLVFIIGAVVITYFVESKEGNGWGAFISAVALGLLFFFFGAREPISNGAAYIVHHPVNIILALLGYFVLGTLWSVVKWFFFLKRKVREFENSSSDYKFDDDGTLKEQYLPKAREHRATILLWMSWWPFSALWTLLNDPFRQAFEWIADVLEQTFDRMSASAFSGVKKRGK